MIRLRTTSGPTAPVGKAKPEVVQIRGHHGCIVGRRSGSSKRFFSENFRPRWLAALIAYEFCCVGRAKPVPKNPKNASSNPLGSGMASVAIQASVLPAGLRPVPANVLPSAETELAPVNVQSLNPSAPAAISRFCKSSMPPAAVQRKARVPPSTEPVPTMTEPSAVTSAPQLVVAPPGKSPNPIMPCEAVQ